MRVIRTASVAVTVAGVLLLAVAANNSGEDHMNSKEKPVTRRAKGSGRWFPADGVELRSAVSNYMEKAVVAPVKGRIVAAIAPHAGYIYSGPVAGYTFRAIRDNAAVPGQKPETVVIIGFTHQAAFDGIALMDGDAIETPMGRAALDKDAASVLTDASKAITFNYAPHAGEHSAENEIPFVQAALPDAKLVVALIGDRGRSLKELVAALEELASQKEILVVASTDMLHDPDYDLVTKTDRATLEKIKALDVEGLQKAWSPTSQVCCGITAVMAVMQYSASQGCKQGTVLRYRNSGDDYPESRGQWVVGYGAVVFALPAK